MDEPQKLGHSNGVFVLHIRSTTKREKKPSVTVFNKYAFIEIKTDFTKLM